MPILSLIKGQYMAKILIAVLDTPLMYAIVRLIPKVEEGKC